ncbi:hypothetical protein K9M74_00605 [Candidatus Woesearchaeota archaeon]|nr:hypothetical protein [Candidatus Woesearchaeota archaeon]
MRRKKGVPSWLLIALGGMIAAYASFINERLNNSPAMKVFMYIGIAIAAFGVLKIIIAWWKNKGHITEEKIAQKIAGMPLPTPRIILCPRCKAKNYNTSHYCHMCGMKLQ